MDAEELKQKCLESTGRENQLESGEKAAGNSAMEHYHSGRKQVWHEVYDILVRWF